METLRQDVRLALRRLLKSPGFAAVAILTLALGIGANTVIFSVVHGALLIPLAYRQPQQLYVVREIVPELAHTYPTLPANLASFRIWQRDCHTFADVAIVEPGSMILTGHGDATEVPGARASANLLNVLGVQPALGRTFLRQEDNPGNDHVVLLSYGFWRQRFSKDRNVVGQAIMLDGATYQVIGILPESFRFPKADQLGPLTEFPPQIDYLKPLGLDAAQWSPFGDFDFAAIARLRPGVNAAQALAELNVVQAQIAKSHNQGMGLRASLIPLQTQVVGTARVGLLLLLGATAAVLLIVCLNLANLLLARIPGRQREVAIRKALGASRVRIARQTLTESLFLAVVGGSLAIVLAYYGLHWLIAIAPASLPRINEVALDARVLWFSVVVSALTGIIFGFLPALVLVQSDPQKSLKAGAVTTTENRSARQLRSSLIGVEVGIGTLLLITAGLLTTSMIRLLDVDKGFTTEHIMAVDINLPPQSYRKQNQKLDFYANVLQRVHALPGVNKAAWISKLPLEGQEQVSDIAVPGRVVAEAQRPIANYRYVTPEYFQAMGIPLLQGRLIEPADRDRPVAVISESVAQKIWHAENPIGKQLSLGGQWPLLQVIGVVADIRTVALDEAPLLMIYLPIGHPIWSGMRASLVVRSTISPTSLSSALRDAIRGVDSQVPIVHLRPMQEIVSESVSVRRFQLGLASSFGLFALLLAALGIHGVVGYSVARRRQELGIRIALGANRSDLQSLVLLQGMSPVLVGWIAGVAAAFIADFLIRSLLFGVSARDPLTIGLASMVVLTTAATACYFPARSAAKVDPMVALRHE